MENALTEAAENPVGADEAEVLETTSTGEEETQEQEEKPARTFTQEELDAKLAKQHNRAERRYAKKFDELKSEMDELRAAQKERGEKPTAGADAAKEPKRTDFDSYEEYVEARADFKAGERIQKEIAELKKDREAETTNRKEQDVQKQLVEMANKRVLAGRKEFADFDSVIQDAFDDEVIVQGSELYLGIIESSVGHRIAHYLAKNPDEAERINGLSVRGVHRELGKLEDKFSKEPVKEKTEAMEPLNGNRRPLKTNDPMREDIPMEDFVRLRNAQDQKRRGY